MLIAKPYAMPTMFKNTAQAGAANRNLLIIEDEGEICLLLNMILGNEDLNIEHVKTLADADAFLSKPFTKAKLLESVKSLIN